MGDAASVRGRRPLLPAAIVSVGVFGVLAWSTVAGSVAAASSEGVHFPAQVDGYSWWTSAHSWSNVGDQVVMMYQNGVGVETMDSPQAVMLAADGITYRRIDAAEALTVPADQGDPAATVLSPDGRVLVIAGANRHGFIEIVSLADDTSRRLSIGDGRSAMPLSIAADGTVVLLLSDTEMSPYLDYGFQMHGSLGLLELSTGVLRELDIPDVHAAAISPDATRIAVDTPSGLMVVDVATGVVRDLGLARGGGWLSDDAWAPDSARFALLDGDRLRVIDVSGAVPKESAVSVDLLEYGAVYGWRDDATAVVYSAGGSNAGRFDWVDVATGRADVFSHYEPGFTGAAIASLDIARDLAAEWQVGPRPADRGPGQLVIAVVLAALAALVVWLVTPRRPKREDHAPAEQLGVRPIPERAEVHAP